MTTTEPPDAMPSGIDNSDPVELAERPWMNLNNTHDVEAWIDHYNRDLKRCIKDPKSKGYGVCFCLGQGGEIFMHTGDDQILLDVTPEAEWAAPVITAATGIDAPHGRIWVLPDDRLTQLVLGLSSLIASTRIVVSHSYKTKKH